MKCMDCATSCAAGMYMEGSCSGTGTVDEVECIACSASTYSTRSGQGISSCIPCPNGTFSDPGSPSCARILSCWPLNVDGNPYRGDGGYNSVSTFALGSRLTFQTEMMLNRSRTFASLAGGASDYVTVQDSNCVGLPMKDFTVSMWVRVDGIRTGAEGLKHVRSAFMGCFKKTTTELNGWFLGTSEDGFYFVFVLRSIGANYASVIADLDAMIQLGAWCVCLIYVKHCVCVRIFRVGVRMCLCVYSTHVCCLVTVCCVMIFCHGSCHKITCPQAYCALTRKYRKAQFMYVRFLVYVLFGMCAITCSSQVSLCFGCFCCCFGMYQNKQMLFMYERKTCFRDCYLCTTVLRTPLFVSLYHSFKDSYIYQCKSTSWLALLPFLVFTHVHTYDVLGLHTCAYM